MSAFVWEAWDLPEDKEPTTELPDGFVRTRYVMGEDMNDIFQALRETADAVRLAGGILHPQAAAPVEEDGTFLRGHIVWNSEPSAGAPVGWICTADGTPGTWVAFGRLDGALPLSQEVEADGESLSLTGTDLSFISFYPDNDVVRGRVGFTSYNFVPDPEEDPPNPADYAYTFYIENSAPEGGHIVIDPGLDAGFHVGAYVFGNPASMMSVEPTRFRVMGGILIDATAERIRFPRGVDAPTTGTYEVGDIFFNSGNPSSHVGWVCTVAGTPGTWVEWGPVQPESVFNGGTISNELISIAGGYGFTQVSGGIEYSSYVGLGMAWMGTVSDDPFAFYTGDGLAQVIFETNGATSIGYTTAQAPSSKLLVNGIIESATGGFKLPDGTIIAEAADLGGGGGGTTDHSLLTNLDADDHTQYALADGTRGSFAALLHTHDDEYAPAMHEHDDDYAALEHEHEDLLTQEEADLLYAPIGSIGGGVTDHGALTGLSDNDHPQYSLTDHDHDLVYAATSHAHSFSSLTGKPTSLAGYGILDAAPLVHNHDADYQPIDTDLTAIAAISTTGYLKRTGAATWSVDTPDHGALGGLSDDDHAQYALADGSRGDFAATGHDHDSDYAALSHDHDADYADIAHNHSGVYQPVDGDLTALAALTGTGYAKRTADNTWTLDAGAGGVTDHGALTGLTDDDHTIYLLADGTRDLTGQLESTVATGTAPFIIASTTKVTNLNADLLDGLSSADFATASHNHDATYSALAHTHDHGAITGLGDDDHTQYLLADGSRVLAALSLSGAIDRSTAALLSIGTTTATGVSIGRAGQPNTITGSQTTLVSAANAYPFRLTDGTRVLSFWVGTSSGLECELGTETNHALSIFTNNGTPQWIFGTQGDFVLRTTPSSTGGAVRFGDSGQRVTYMAAAPASGTWVRGSVVYNTAPSASGFVGWVCTTAGTPGTWKTFGAISA